MVSRHLPRRAGPIVRQGIANLYRPGNHAGAAVMALGVGVMFTVTIWIVQRGLLKDIVRTAPPGMPNVYLLDITASNRDAVYDLLSKQAGIEGKPGDAGSGLGADAVDRWRSGTARANAGFRAPILANGYRLDRVRKAAIYRGCRGRVVGGRRASRGAGVVGGRDRR